MGPVSWSVGRRGGPDPVWLWLWPAAATLTGPLAGEPPYAAGAALEKAKRQNKEKKKKFLNFTKIRMTIN